MKIPVRYNHVGYAPAAAKIFFVNPAELAVQGLGTGDCLFRIVGESSEIFYEGSLKTGSMGHQGVCEYTGEQLWSGNFTELNIEGKYRIQLWLRGAPNSTERKIFESELFEISNAWLERQLHANIKSFFYQRSGVELPAEFAGKWARPAAHFDNCIGFHRMMEREGTWDAHGGWYDAGDYGKYIVNGGVSVASLLLACELSEESKNSPAWKAVHGGGTFDLPYGLEDEVRFELEFFLRMQDNDGGVFFKVTPEHWDGFVSPRDSDLLQKRMVLGKSTTSTLNFAGAMAGAAHVYRASDPDFANQCLQSALRAYRWAAERPFVDWPHNTEGSGGYGDEHAEDEFFWARAMLYRELLATGNDDEARFVDALRVLLAKDMMTLSPKLGLDWRDTQNLGWIALALQNVDMDLQSRARKALESAAEAVINLQKKDAYGISLQKFIWGSNGEIANHALTLAIVKLWKPELNGESLDFWCREALNFIYGRNPVDTSFVTGSAWSSPRFPHHRLSHSDGVPDPIPGLLVGGLNNDRQDMHRAPHYPGILPGFAYTDERCSFASNETAINWNAPLTAVLALLCA
ncbi:glycoside hydrolase family 9 protein [uncultured Fibrobacter sp.]|uniref:glycoside hydrolase family 9 protein n=1 Tax=uncultured Fibrobacter sp. TaxID=261512 RepID=UPI00261E4ABE|nr:glycoside hydrolase family 9 protein [uncultured Fibrobacter sp.]